MPTSNPHPASRPKRASCDRCHSQKLRCLRRTSNEEDSCSRCLRQGVECVYSSPLPKGRPRGTKSTMHPGTDTDASLSSQNHQSSSSNNSSRSSFSPPTPGHTSSLLLPPTLDAARLGTGLSDEDLGFVTNAWPSSKWDLTSNDQALHNLDFLPVGISFGAEYNEMLPPPYPQLRPHDGPTAGPEDPDDLNSHGMSAVPSDSSPLLPARIDDTEVCVRQLSDLTARLYSVYRTSCGLDSVPRNEHASSSITTAIFEAVTALFHEDPSPMPSSTTPSALNEAFTASRTLLEILFRLLENAELTNSGSADSGTAGNRAEPVRRPSGMMHIPVDLRAGSTVIGAETGSGNSHEPVVYHIATTCYSLLLLIHITLIGALQRNVFSHTSQESSASGSTSPSTSSSSLSASAYSPPSMVELRLVLLVQLMAYFLDRLQQTMSAYSAQVARRPRRQSLDGGIEMLDELNPYQVPLPDTISALESRARSRLSHLRRTLNDTRARN
ncbi:hypothetical protein BBP40_002766 [Aspergillus hancockii]|nr:hypothetical protein BBP40_002766 [Aspergillus hancockii]